MRTHGLIVGLFIFALFPGVARADDGGVDIMGGGARLMDEQPDITMSDEYVLIDMQPHQYRIRATFHFFNHGASTTVAVGFPVYGGGAEGAAANRDFTYFRTWVNGKVVVTTDVPNIDYKDSDRGFAYFKVKQVAFPAASTTTSVVEYDAPYGGSSNGVNWVRYPYGTGSSWDGPIGKAIFDIRFDEGLLGLDVQTSDPASKVNRSLGQIVFEMNSLDPEIDGNLAIEFYSLDFHGCYRGEVPDPEQNPGDICPLIVREVVPPNEGAPTIYGIEKIVAPPYPSLTDYRLKRNAVFAQHGFVFKDLKLEAFFAGMPWYKPDPHFHGLSRSEQERAQMYKDREDEILRATHYSPRNP